MNFICYSKRNYYIPISFYDSGDNVYLLILSYMSKNNNWVICQKIIIQVLWNCLELNNYVLSFIFCSEWKANMLNNEFFTVHVKVVNSVNFGWIELITVAEAGMT